MQIGPHTPFRSTVPSPETKLFSTTTLPFSLFFLELLTPIAVTPFLPSLEPQSIYFSLRTWFFFFYVVQVTPILSSMKITFSTAPLRPPHQTYPTRKEGRPVFFFEESFLPLPLCDSMQVFHVCFPSVFCQQDSIQSSPSPYALRFMLDFYYCVFFWVTRPHKPFFSGGL